MIGEAPLEWLIAYCTVGDIYCASAAWKVELDRLAAFGDDDITDILRGGGAMDRCCCDVACIIL